MAGIKKINVVNDEGNPVKITDLQNLWEGLSQALTPINIDSEEIAKIVSGFQANQDDTFGPGFVWYNGQAYYFAGGNRNEYLYVGTTQEDQRVTQQGKQIQFYTNYVARTSTSPSNTELGVLIGQLTPHQVETWKAVYIPVRSLNGDMLKDDTITARQLGTNCVRTANITPLSVTSEKLANGAISSSKLQPLMPGTTFDSSMVLNTHNWIYFYFSFDSSSQTVNILHDIPSFAPVTGTVSGSRITFTPTDHVSGQIGLIISEITNFTRSPIKYTPLKYWTQVDALNNQKTVTITDTFNVEPGNNVFGYAILLYSVRNY